MEAAEKAGRRAWYPLVLSFAILALGVVAGGIFYYRNYERHFRDEAGQQLSAIAELKVDELAQYRRERLWDADAFFKNTAFSGLVRRLLEHPEDAEAQQQIQEWIVKCTATKQYDLGCLFDAQGVIRLSVPAGRPPISSFVSQHIPEVLRSGQVTFQDFHRNEHDQQVYLTLLVPILDGPGHNQALGVLALRIDPKTYLYPFLKRWPTPSRTVETLLVRRDGNDALYLNELKFETSTALNLRIPLENTNVPAVKAVLGQEGIVEGRDYRGELALADLQAVPDSPWFLVARINAAEVYAPLNERLRLTILFVSLLLIGAGLGISAIRRRQRLQFYKEQYEMAEALRESEERFRRVFEEGPTGMAMLNEEFRFIQVNPAFASMLGYSGEELRTMAFTDITHPEHVQNDVEQMRRLLRGELPVYRTEKRYIAKSGKELWGQVQVAVVRDADGAFRHFLAIISDIHGRKQAEEELRNSRALYFSLVENLPQSIFRKDRDGRFQFVNERFCRGLRRSSEDIVGRTDADFFPPELAQAYRKDDLRVMETGQVLDQEEKHVGADGRELFVHVIKTPLRDAQGRIIGVQGVFSDITGRKQAEESLHYEQTLMAALMENIPDAVYFKDTASRFLRVNRAFSRKFGLSDPAQVVGKSDADFFTEEHGGQARADEQEIIRTGQPLVNIEEKETWPDGSETWVLSTKLPLRDDAGRVIGTCGISRDITDRKRAEETIARERQLLRTLIDRLPETFYIKDLDSRFLVANEALAKQLGKDTPSQVLGLSDADFFPAGLAAEFRAEEMKIFAGESFINRENTMVSPDGRERTVLTTKLPYRDSEGRICGLVGIGRDITERKQAEEALRMNQERLLRVIMQTRCILSFGHAEGPADWRERALNPKSPFNWDIPVLNVEAAQKILPLELAAGEQYENAWFRSRNRADYSQMDWNSGNAFLNDLPFYRNEFRCTDKNGVGHWMQEFVTVRKLAENRWEVFSIATDISDLKRIETELRESQALYHSLVDQMPAAVFRKDANGRFVFVNSAFCRLKDMPPEQFLGKTASELELKDVALATKGASDHAKIMQSGNPIEDDEIYFSADGQTRNYHAVKSPVLNSAGIIVGTQGILFDITELKQATQRIADMLNFNQTVLRASPVGIVAYKASGRCVSANETIGQIIGGTREEVLKQNFRQLESWKQSGILAAAEAALAAQAERDLETQIVTSFGRKAWFSCRLAPFDYEGEAHLLLIVTDTTERKRTEEALRWSETQLQVILESTADGIMAVDSKGKRVIKANRRFTELWRIPQSLMDAGDNRALLDFVRNQLSDPDAFLKKAQSLYGTDAVDMDTLAFKDGRIFERYGFPMIMDGVVTGRVWSFRDITGRKRQEKELSDKNTELERFTYTVSHDLKSPLVTVKTFLGYLEQDLAGPDKERVKQDVAYMHTAADKMGRLLDELLNLARVGRKMNPAERVTFKELAQEAVRLVAGRISTGGAEVQVADAAVVLEGDRSRLMEIWQNLVENACKFMGNQPRPRVEIGVEKRASETVFFVRDNGAGIDPRYHDKVFGLFEKLDPKGEGTGMGLALVKRIVEMYKGRIWVESPGLGQGANFLFTLPAAIIIDPEPSS